MLGSSEKYYPKLTKQPNKDHKEEGIKAQTKAFKY
jgi:hypothetical protein